jgi:hypothetical protein
MGVALLALVRVMDATALRWAFDVSVNLQVAWWAMAIARG